MITTQKPTAGHTPGPWQTLGLHYIGSGNLREHGQCPDTLQGMMDTEFIVRCCNSHDALVEALKSILPLARSYVESQARAIDRPRILAAELALERAEGTK